MDYCFLQIIYKHSQKSQIDNLNETFSRLDYDYTVDDVSSVYDENSNGFKQVYFSLNNCNGNILKEIVNNLEVFTEDGKLGLKYLLEIGREGVEGKFRLHINKRGKKIETTNATKLLSLK
jgi:hypothetical protein